MSTDQSSLITGTDNGWLKRKIRVITNILTASYVSNKEEGITEVTINRQKELLSLTDIRREKRNTEIIHSNYLLIWGGVVPATRDRHSVVYSQESQAQNWDLIYGYLKEKEDTN